MHLYGKLKVSRLLEYVPMALEDFLNFTTVFRQDSHRLIVYACWGEAVPGCITWLVRGPIILYREVRMQTVAYSFFFNEETCSLLSNQLWGAIFSISWVEMNSRSGGIMNKQWLRVVADLPNSKSNQSINHSVNQSINRSINHPITQSINQSISYPSVTFPGKP